MDITATEVMRRCVQTVPATMSLPELERAFTRAGVWGFPVVDGERVIGVVSRSDVVGRLDLEHQTAQKTSDFYRDANGFHEAPLVTTEEISGRVGERMEHLTVQDVMHRHIYSVPPEHPLRAVAGAMIEHDIHRILVTREGKLLGVISTGDFVRLYTQGRIKPA